MLLKHVNNQKASSLITQNVRIPITFLKVNINTIEFTLLLFGLDLLNVKWLKPEDSQMVRYSNGI